MSKQLIDKQLKEFREKFVGKRYIDRKMRFDPDQDPKEIESFLKSSMLLVDIEKQIDFISSLLQQESKGLIGLCKRCFTMKPLVKTQKYLDESYNAGYEFGIEKLRVDIRKWAKGKIVTKEKLRHFLNNYGI